MIAEANDEGPERDPLPPPFHVGTRLRCIEGHAAYVPCVDRPSPGGSAAHPEEWVRISGAGIEVTIDHVVNGRRGTGRQLRDDDGPMYYEDDGEPMLDTTEDGYSVYRVVRGTGHAAKMSGRCIRPDDAHKWQVIEPERVGPVLCPWCDRVRIVNLDGTVRVHRSQVTGRTCQGSGQPGAGMPLGPRRI